jgi:hypothetical protein
MSPIDLLHEVIHTAEYVMPREAVVKWLRLNAPHYQFTERTAKGKIARMFAISFYRVYKDELAREIEQAVERERARSKYETWFRGVEEAFRTRELCKPSDYFSTNEGDYYTVNTRDRCNNPDTCGNYV